VERIEGGGMKIEKLKNTVAPIIGIYGEPGVGKTTLASKFVKSIWMAVATKHWLLTAWTR
jgi:putative protein kinase ArgK-like GTPase of G3E family